jgi:hypothetical protein
MVGRRRVRGSGVTTLSIVALAMVLALVFVPSMGPGAVPAGLVASVSPAAAVVHLLGDEVVASTPLGGQELRARSFPAGGASLATLVLTAALAAVLGAVWVLGPVPTVPRPAAIRAARSGRSPPRRAVTR